MAISSEVWNLGGISSAASAGYSTAGVASSAAVVANSVASSAGSLAGVASSAAVVADSKASSAGSLATVSSSAASSVAVVAASAIGSEPGNSEFKVTDIKRNSAGSLVIEFDDSAVGS